MGKILRVLRWLLITAVSTVLLLEVALQIAAVLIQDSDRSAAAFLSVDDTLRVLAVGDSHTYGLYLEADETYPAQLKKLWDEEPRERGLEVINVGFPGTNSSRVLSNIDSLLTTFKPDVVLLLVGINDYWTEPVATSGATRDRSPLRSWLSKYSRVYKLAYMLQRQMYNSSKLEVDESLRALKYDPSLKAAFSDSLADEAKTMEKIPNAVRYGDQEFSIGYESTALRRDKPMMRYFANLQNIIEIVERHGVRLVLMTYETDDNLLLKSVNMQIRKVAEGRHLPVLELSTAFSRQCPEVEDCPLLFPDFHPTALGQKEIARQVMAVLLAPEAPGSAPPPSSNDAPREAGSAVE